MTKKIEFTESCGNVFADLGLENADEMLAKSTLAIMIRKIIKKRGLTQAQAAKIFGYPSNTDCPAKQRQRR